MKDKKKASVVFAFVGVIMGYVSFLITNSLETNLLQPFIAILAMVFTSEIMKYTLKIKKDFKWFLSSGGWLYYFVWFVTWVVFFNL